MIIRDRAILVHPKLTSFTFRVTDRRATAKVLEENAAKAKTGEFKKRLFTNETAEFKAITDFDAAVRDYHREKTLPWLEDGSRILAISLFDDYMGVMKERLEQRPVLVNTLLERYEQLIDARMADMGGLFDRAEFPPVEKLRKKFSFELLTVPIPDGGDFRVAMADQAMAELKDSVNTQLKEAAEQGRLEMFRRLAEPVAHMANVLAQEKKPFHDTLVRNIQEIVQLLPKLNSAVGDPAIEQLCAAADALAAVDPDKLRKNPSLREMKAKEATAIVQQMAAYLEEEV